MAFNTALDPARGTSYRRGRGAKVLGTIATGMLLGLAPLAFSSTASAQILGSTSLHVERAGHSATRLEDGRILITGGENAGGALRTAELYDPTTQRFSLTGSLIVPRTDHTATLLADGRVLIAGGRQGAAHPPSANPTPITPLASTEVYDPTTGSFSAGPPLTSARSGHTATVLSNGRILVASGDAQGSAEIFDPTTFTFTALAAPLTTPRWFAGTALLQDGTVLIAGGADARGHGLPSAEIFTPGTSSFAAMDSTLQVPRENPLLRVLPDGKVLIIGGSDDSTVELFDPAGPIIRAYARVLNVSNTLSDILHSQTRSALIHLLDPNDPLLQPQLTPGTRALLERTGSSLTEMPESNQALVAGGADRSGHFLKSANIVGSSPATVTTDRSDYPVGSTVEISGTNWQPGETVLITIHEEPWPPRPHRSADPDPVYSAVADPQGGFLNTDFSPDATDLGRTFTVTAVGQTSGFVAQTAFTDATSGNLTTNNVSQVGPVTAAPGALKVPILSFTITTGSNTGEKFKQAKPTFVGNMTNDIQTLYLYCKAGGVGPGCGGAPGTFDASTDTLVDACTLSAGGTGTTGNCDPSDFNVPANATLQFFVVVDVKTMAVLGHTIDFRFGNDQIFFQTGTWPPSSEVTAATWDPAGVTTIKGNTTTTITSDTPDPSVVGLAYTVNFTVPAVSPATGTPTGSVTVSDGSASCTGTLTGGSASCSLTSTTAGAKTLTATYAGDATFSGSSGTAGHTVNPADTTTAVTSSQNPSTFGQAVTFTASVSAVAPGSGTPDGAVAFTADGTTITGCSTVPLSNGSATCATSALGVPGSPHAITATYSGSSTYSAGSPGTLSGGQTVTKADQTLSWSTPAAITYGTALGPAQLNATVSVPGPDPAGALTYTPPAGAILTAGSGQPLSVTAAATASYNQATRTVSITVLKATPVITWATPADITYGTALGAAQLNATANVPGSFTYTPASGTILNAGSNQPLHVDFTPADAANYTTASKDVSINVLQATPTITGFSPAFGQVGDLVIIAGTNFFSVLSVSFNGTNAAGFSVTSPTSLSVAVPTGATTGPLSVTTPAGIAVSADAFVVIGAVDFLLTATPATGTAVPGTGTTFSVSVVAFGDYTNLVSLAVSGLPPGATATLTPLQVAPGASARLDVTVPSALAPGTYPFTVTGTGLVNGTLMTRSVTPLLTTLPQGTTALSGRVVTEEEAPLPNVTIRLGTLTTQTDGAGSFHLTNPPTGPQVVLLDGSTASTPTASYPTIPVTVTIAPGQVTPLGFTPYFYAQPVGRTVPFIPGQATTLTDPAIPNMTVQIPAGVTIIGWDGQPNTQLGMRVVPPDRSPLPPLQLPPGYTAGPLYMFYFGKVGGGTPTAPVPIIGPNEVGDLPGERVDLYFYDEAPDGSRPNAWAKYGTGTVSSDATQILPDTDPATGRPYGMPRFCCGAWVPVAPPQDRPPSTAATNRPALGQGLSGGEPVDLASGLFVLQKTDLVLPGRLPLALTRTYRTLDSSPGPFGPGTSHAYEVFLQSLSADALLLTLPGNSRALFSRQPDGRFRNGTEPGLRGAAATASASTRLLTFKDGATWTFDGNGRLVAQRDRNGNQVTITRDGQGRVMNLTEPAGRQFTFSYSGTSLQVTQVTDPLGRTVRYSYDAAGRLTSVTDPAGGVTRYTYDSLNRLLTITDPRGILFLRNEYDGAGRVSRQTQADGGVFTFAYTLTSGVVTQTAVTDPRGNRTTARFNTSGYLISQTDALGQPTSFERQLGANLLLSVTDPLGRKASFEYDPAGNVTRITDPTGAMTQYAYDPTFNRPSQATNALGQTTTYTYDGKGNLTGVTDPQGRTTTFTYDGVGQLMALTDSTGRISRFEYNDQGDLVAVTNPLGVRVTQTTDALSRLLEVMDGNGKVTRFTYDALNRPLTAVGPLGNTVTMAYDANSNLTEVLDARGEQRQFGYDGMGQLIAQVDPTGQRETFSYDQAGNLVQAVNRRGQIATLDYDALDRLQRLTLDDGSRIEYAYDAAGHLAQTTDSVAGTISRTYDGVGQLLSETTAQGTVSYTYDLLGRRTQMTVDDEAPVTYQYDAQGRFAEVQQGPLSASLQYDLLGRATQLAFSNGVATTYQYDLASRLTALTHQLPTGLYQSLGYTYDNRGNRTSVSGRATWVLLPDPVTVAAANALNQYPAFGDQSLAYDADGHLTSLTGPAGTTTFTWDPRGQLVAIAGPSLTASFAYDAFGRRVQKTVNGVTSEFLYDGLDIVQEVRDGVPITYLRGLDLDEIWARTEAGLTQFYVGDELGSTVALTDAAGTIQTQYTYGPFGATEMSGTPSPNPFQYTGRENDGTGLYYFRNRYYSPALARFISEDPVGFLGGGNFYAYVGNNPCTFVDLLGLGPCEVGRFTTALSTTSGRSFSAEDLNNALALVYAEVAPGYRRSSIRREFDLAGKDLGPVRTELDDFGRAFEAQGVASTLINRLGHVRFGRYRGPHGMVRGPETLSEVIFAPDQFRAARNGGNREFQQALQGGERVLDCQRYQRAYAAVRDTVLIGPLLDVDAFRGVVQEGGVYRTLRRDLGQSNYGGTDFGRTSSFPIPAKR